MLLGVWVRLLQSGKMSYEGEPQRHKVRGVRIRYIVQHSQINLIVYDLETEEIVGSIANILKVIKKLDLNPLRFIGFIVRRASALSYRNIIIRYPLTQKSVTVGWVDEGNPEL